MQNGLVGHFDSIPNSQDVRALAAPYLPSVLLIMYIYLYIMYIIIILYYLYIYINILSAFFLGWFNEKLASRILLRFSGVRLPLQSFQKSCSSQFLISPAGAVASQLLPWASIEVLCCPCATIAVETSSYKGTSLLSYFKFGGTQRFTCFQML